MLPAPMVPGLAQAGDHPHAAPGLAGHVGTAKRTTGNSILEKPVAETTPSPDPYAVLRLSPAATPREITRAYRALMRTHHPDTNPAGQAPGNQATARELQEIMDAYTFLRDPARRRAYDRQRRTPMPAPADP